MKGWALLAFVVALAACVDTGLSVTRTKAASDFGCPPDQIRVSDIGGSSTLAEGCGKHAVYVCGSARGSASMVCAQEAAPTVAATQASDAGAP